MRPDSVRVNAGHDHWLILIGICTQLGCVPLGHQGDYDGWWFCPCHGSQCDTAESRQARPGTKNLYLPPYTLLSDTKVRSAELYVSQPAQSQGLRTPRLHAPRWSRPAHGVQVMVIVQPAPTLPRNVKEGHRKVLALALMADLTKLAAYGSECLEASAPQIWYSRSQARRMTNNSTFDVIIVGAGPAGLNAALGAVADACWSAPSAITAIRHLKLYMAFFPGWHQSHGTAAHRS